MKFIILLAAILFGFSLTSSGQETSGTKLIREFYKEIYNKETKPEDVVSKYVIFSDTAGYCGYKNAVQSVKYIRYPTDGKDGHFSLLKMDIMENNFLISGYDSFSVIEKNQFNNLKEKVKNNLYKVSPKHTIPGYILLKSDKIASFFGFKKAGSESHIFIVYQ